MNACKITHSAKGGIEIDSARSVCTSVAVALAGVLPRARVGPPLAGPRISRARSLPRPDAQTNEGCPGLAAIIAAARPRNARERLHRERERERERERKRGRGRRTSTTGHQWSGQAIEEGRRRTGRRWPPLGLGTTGSALRALACGSSWWSRTTGSCGWVTSSSGPPRSRGHCNWPRSL